MTAGMFDPVCPECSLAITQVPTPETAPFMPMSMYGLTKQVQDQAILLFAKTKGINAFALRYQNVFGPGQSLKNPYTGILAVFSNLARQDQDIEIYEDGLESRDFVYVDDVVEATCRSIVYSEKFVGAINVGSGVATSVLSVAQKIKDFYSSKGNINITGNFRIGDIRHNIADIGRLKSILGFVPSVTLETGLDNFLNWTSQYRPEDGTKYRRSVEELSAHRLLGKFVANDRAAPEEVSRVFRPFGLS